MVHGSALFQRGETQVLAAATVAATEARDASQGAPNLYVQYSSPPWANNEVSPRSLPAGLAASRDSGCRRI